jgi:hypothetical protein
MLSQHLLHRNNNGRQLLSRRRRLERTPQLCTGAAFARVAMSAVCSILFALKFPVCLNGERTGPILAVRGVLLGKGNTERKNRSLVRWHNPQYKYNTLLRTRAY